MTDRTAPADDPSSLPMQPTGSGVADLEVAYEQMKLAEAEDLPAAETTGDDALPPASGSGLAESEAHPS